MHRRKKLGAAENERLGPSTRIINVDITNESTINNNIQYAHLLKKFAFSKTNCLSHAWHVMSIIQQQFKNVKKFEIL